MSGEHDHGPRRQRVERGWVDSETESQQTLGAPGEHVQRPALKAFVASHRRRSANSATESGDHPQRAGQHDLDAVVDRVLNEEQCDPHRREPQSQPDHIGSRRRDHDDRERDHGHRSDTQHRRNGSRPSHPPRPSRFGGEHRADRTACRRTRRFVGHHVGVTPSDRLPAEPAEREIVRLIGVYDADGTVRGELSYWFAARLGRAHCSLCDITHGLLRERPEWKTCRSALPVPFDTYHRDDQPDSVRASIGDRAPAVVAETKGGTVRLLGPTELVECRGSIDTLVRAIKDQVTRNHLAWPTQR